LTTPVDAAGTVLDAYALKFERKDLQDPGKLSVPIYHPGTPLDVNRVDGGLVVTERVGTLLEALASGDIRRFPARVVSMPGRYDFVNIVSWRDCIDRERTRVSVLVQGDAEPVKNGTLASLAPLLEREAAGEPGIYSTLMAEWLRLDPDRIDGAQIFWVEGRAVWPVVTEEIKLALEAENVTGLSYTLVC